MDERKDHCLIRLGCVCRRPDYCLGPHLRQMLTYGCTRLEIGVQSTYEDVARDTNRGHTVAAVEDCFRLAKDAGFKVIYFMAGTTTVAS